MNTTAYQRYIASELDSPLRRGNSVEILTNGNEIFPAMVEAIKGAQQSVALLTYVYWKGEVAKQFAETLAERARSGVSVCILMDAFGSSKIDFALVKHMRESGVIVRRFRPLRGHTVHRYNYRTHRKILVVDSAIGFIGGVGIAQEWTGDAQNKRHWRDTHFGVTGPAVKDLVDSFNDNWQEAGGDRMITSVSNKRTADSTALQITSSKRVKNGRTNADKLFYEAIRTARRSLNITTAYFAPSIRFRHALMQASKRGVQVTVLTNGPNTNHKVVRKAGHRYYHQLLESGVRIYEYQKTLMHAKVMTIDGSWATVGSINFDDRSFVLNDEIGMSFNNKQLVQELDDQLVEDIKDSKEIVLHHWQSRSHVAKAGEVLSNLARTQL